jgi:hypothetical protein
MVLRKLISRLLEDWVSACASLPDHSANVVDHHGALLVQSQALVDLQ